MNTCCVERSKTSCIGKNWIARINDIYFDLEHDSNHEIISIEDYAFSGCSKLSSLMLPKNLTDIGGHAFWGCDKLSSVKIPSRLTSIDATAFSSCDR